MLQSNRPCATRRSPSQTAQLTLKNGSTPGPHSAGSAAWKNPRKLKRRQRGSKRRPEESASPYEQTWQPDSAHLRWIREGSLGLAIAVPAARPRVLGLAALSERLGENAQPPKSYRFFFEPRTARAARHGHLRLVIRIHLRNSAGLRFALPHCRPRPGD